jgi:hypothetical protein
MTKVYRVEDPDSFDGPYTATHLFGDATLAMQSDHNTRAFGAHPTPLQSMSHSMGAYEKCAMIGMRQLFAWFGGWLPGMLREGFVITVIDAEIMAGPDETGQVVFKDHREADALCV